MLAMQDVLKILAVLHPPASSTVQQHTQAIQAMLPPTPAAPGKAES